MRLRTVVMTAPMALLLPAFAFSQNSSFPPPTGVSGGSGTVTSIATSCGIYGGTITATGTLTSKELVNSQTGVSYTFLDSDCGGLVSHSNVSATADTLPQANGATFRSGWYVDVQNAGSGTVTITPTISAIDGVASIVLISGQGMRLVSDGTNYFTVRGQGARNLAAVSHKFLTSIVNGLPSAAQPACADLSDAGTGCNSAAISLIQDEGLSLPVRSTINFTGSGITCADSGGTKTACDVPGGGGGSPGGSLGAVQFNSPLGTFTGSADLRFFDTALANAAAPTVTPVGTTGATAWAYKCQAYRYSGGMSYSTASSTTIITNGNATLDGTNKNNVACAAVAGATFIELLRVTAAGSPSTLGAIGSVAGTGGTLVDTGLAGPALFGGVPVGNTSTGLFTAQYLNQSDLGDVENATWFGTPRQDLPATAYGRMCCTKNAFVHSGATDNVFANAVFLSVPTTVAGNAIEAITLTNGATDTSEGGAALYAEAGNIGSTDSNQEQGVVVTIGTHGAGGIINGEGFRVLSPYKESAGTFGAWYSFDAPDVDSSVVTGQAVGFYSGVSAATNHWAFYGAGTAASHFGGLIDVPQVQTVGVFTSALPTCASGTWGMRGAVIDATAPAIGIALTGGGTVFATVHCSKTTSTYFVDGL